VLASRRFLPLIAFVISTNNISKTGTGERSSPQKKLTDEQRICSNIARTCNRRGEGLLVETRGSGQKRKIEIKFLDHQRPSGVVPVARHPTIAYSRQRLNGLIDVTYAAQKHRLPFVDRLANEPH